ncbi:MAG: SDR family oxidoreductase [Ferruginibacter sp.]|jgi:hypothetical protein
MRITVFGSTGQVGQQIVRQALYEGHQVRAFGRNVYTTPFPDDKNLERIKGALFDEDQVSHAIKGTDVVLSALGGAFDGTDKARSLGIKNIIEQMKKNGVGRIIALGGKGQLDTADGNLLMDSPDFPEIFLPVSREHRQALEYLQESGLDWTFVCSPDIIPGDATGEFRTSPLVAPEPDHNRIFTGDLALFMLNEMVKHQYSRMKVGISN